MSIYLGEQTVFRGSESTGTSDYTDLVNKPSINGVTLNGNKSLVELGAMSSGNFIPGGTTITVKTDGTGDFTSLADAVSYLTGKYSNGPVTISIGSGTFSVSNMTINGANFNIPCLKIVGAGVSNTILSNSTQSGEGIKLLNPCFFLLQNFTYKKPATTIAPEGTGILGSEQSIVKIDHVVIEGCAAGINGSNNITMNLRNGNITVKYAKHAIKAAKGGRVSVEGINFVFNNCTTAWHVETGGSLIAEYPTCTYTTVTNKTSQTTGTATNKGWIVGINT